MKVYYLLLRVTGNRYYILKKNILYFLLKNPYMCHEFTETIMCSEFGKYSSINGRVSRIVNLMGLQIFTVVNLSMLVF
jgi:hypothetical protein